MKHSKVRAGGVALVSVALAGLAASPALASQGVTVGSLSSLKAGATSGTLGGQVVNRTDQAVNAKVSVRIQRTGAPAKFVGNTRVRVGAAASGVPMAGGYADRCGPGPRQPLVVISPYAKKNYVDHTQTDQASILRFIEDNWRTSLPASTSAYCCQHWLVRSERDDQNFGAGFGTAPAEPTMSRPTLHSASVAARKRMAS